MAKARARRRYLRQRPPTTPAQFKYELHTMMLRVGVGLILIGAVGHACQPADELWKWAFYGGAGFLMGKFTNMIGQGLLPPKPETPAAPSAPKSETSAE
ncbi:MAG: hypothetical protein H0W99_17315 [Acidobacteria bacterium]|nr:hypothetical protein [Acidobacteriota bacterium]